MTDRVLNELKGIAEEEQVVKLRLQRQTLNVAAQKLATVNKRKSERIESARIAKKRKVEKMPKSRDNIRIHGLKGTLGWNVLRLGLKITEKDSKSKYFSRLSQNGIVDVTNFTEGSQMQLLGLTKKSKFVTDLSLSTNQSVMDLSKIVDLSKMTDKQSAKSSIRTLDKYKPKDNLHRAIKATMRHILEQNVYRSPMLADDYLQECSELSIMIKYWGFVFEQCLGYSKNVFLQWGDTLSSQSADIGTTARLDIRIITISDNNGRIEAATGEFANVPSTTKSKLFADRLKSVLVSKVHLNHALFKMKHISENAISTIKMPVIQVMGLNCCVYSLSLIDKGVYCLQPVCEFQYPRTIQQIQEGVLGILIQGIVKVRAMMRDLEDAIEQYSRTIRNKMMEVLETNKRTAPKKVDLIDWTTPMISFGDVQQDENNDDSNNGSEEDSDHDAADNTTEQDEDNSDEDGNSDHDSILK